MEKARALFVANASHLIVFLIVLLCIIKHKHTVQSETLNLFSNKTVRAKTRDYRESCVFRLRPLLRRFKETKPLFVANASHLIVFLIVLLCIIKHKHTVQSETLNLFSNKTVRAKTRDYRESCVFRLRPLLRRFKETKPLFVANASHLIVFLIVLLCIIKHKHTVQSKTLNFFFNKTVQKTQNHQI